MAAFVWNKLLIPPKYSQAIGYKNIALANSVKTFKNMIIEKYVFMNANKMINYFFNFFNPKS